MKQNGIGFLLGGLLRQRPANPTFYAQLQNFIFDGSNSFNDRGHLLHVLGQAKTKESLDLLIKSATTLQEQGLKLGQWTKLNPLVPYGAMGHSMRNYHPHLRRFGRHQRTNICLAR